MKTRTLFIALIAILLGVWYFAAKSGGSATKISRPNDPWVFRSVLDKQPRMITFALSEQMWASYSTDSCSLYKIWSGSTDFTGAVYNMRHGPQPMSVGAAWFENAHRQPWSVTIGGKTESPRTDYKGHRYTKDGHAELMYDLVLADGQRIRINERPEYLERDRQHGFERNFTVENAPSGATVTLKTNAASIADASNIETDGDWKQTDSKTIQTEDALQALEVTGELTLKPSGSTRLRTMFVNKPLIENPFDAARFAQESGESGGKVISPGEKLMAKSDCRTCHNAAVQTVGPGYKQIAERYKNTPENVELLSQKVMKGGAGVWGVAAMSAHPDLQPEDAKAMVNYVLSLDEGEDDGEGGGAAKSLAEIPDNQWLKADNTVGDRDLSPGLFVKLWPSPNPCACWPMQILLQNQPLSPVPAKWKLVGKILAISKTIFICKPRDTYFWKKTTT
jgi:cytochrome c